jgi:hypothetical protein
VVPPNATAKTAPLMAAVRVLRSACKTSQSTQIVRGPSFRVWQHRVFGGKPATRYALLFIHLGTFSSMVTPQMTRLLAW